MQLGEGQLKQYILRKLGQPFFKVELDDNSLQDAVTDAILCYSRWKPVKLHRAYSFASGILQLTPTSNPAIPANADGLWDCTWTTNIAQGNPDIEAQMLSGSFAFFGVRSPLYDIRFLHYQRQWVRFAGKELNSEPDFAFRLNEETGIPALWLYSPGYGTDFDVTFSARHADLTMIPDFDEPRIKGLAVASAKKTLGQIRSKYDKVLVANTSMALNGPALLDEGTKEWETEEEKLKRSVSDQAPIWA